MKCTIAVTCVLLAVPLSFSTGGNARAAIHTAKQQCISTCRARYRDCRHLKQLPPFECRGIYQDCSRYHCTGLGPG
jgi:hypothetical protein